MGTLPRPPSPISGYSLSFATEVVKALYYCCSIFISPKPPLSFYPCFAAATAIDKLLLTLYHKMLSLSSLVQSCEYACPVCSYTQLFMWHFKSETGWYLENMQKKETEKNTVNSSICHVFHLQDFFFRFILFCPC